MNGEIQKNLARRADRALAYLIDILPITLAVFAIAYFFLGFDDVMTRYFNRGDAIEPRIEFIRKRNLIRESGFLLWIIYCTFMEFSASQGTLGKRAVRIKVIDHEGNRLTFQKSLLRNLTKILSYLLFLGFIWILFDKKKQGWHDKINKTFVVQCSYEKSGSPDIPDSQV